MWYPGIILPWTLSRHILGHHRYSMGICRPGQAVHEALVDHMPTRTRQDIFQYQERFDEVHAAPYQWDVRAAAYLIAGVCSDDSFMDFRTGLRAQGRDWYQKAAASPDSLAAHPDVASTVHRPLDNALFYEEVNYAASDAFERVSGDDHGLYDAWDRYSASRDQSDRSPADMGEDFDFDDAQQMRRRLPRPSALCLRNGSA
jgi:hypothetical protein